VVNYERLEFLGDAMLSAVIASYLFEKVPHGDEGYLTKMRSKVVSREHLNELGKELKLIDLVESKIPTSNFGSNIHGNLFEALIGAIFLDKGYKQCEKFIFKRVIDPHVDIETLEGKVISYKSLLIEWCQKEKKSFDYNVYEDTGNDDLKHFSVKLSINDKVISKARATSKKKAEEKASKRAFFAFQNEITKSF
jgi:ribonuclease-3